MYYTHENVKCLALFILLVLWVAFRKTAKLYPSSQEALITTHHLKMPDGNASLLAHDNTDSFFYLILQSICFYDWQREIVSL